MTRLSGRKFGRADAGLRPGALPWAETVPDPIGPESHAEAPKFLN